MMSDNKYFQYKILLLFLCMSNLYDWSYAVFVNQEFLENLKEFDYWKEWKNS